MICTRIRVALILATLAVFPLAEAKAIMITINSVVKNAGDTGNYSQNNSANAGEWQSQTSILSSGANTPDVVSAAVQAKTRYASVLGSDSNALNFGARSDSANTNYSVTFTVTPQFLVTTYSLQIDTARLGALIVREEGGSAGVADITAVTGTLSNPFTGTLNLADIPGVNSNSTAVTHINQTASAFVTGPLSGVQVFTLNFSWSQNTSSGNNVISGGDEGVVLLGLAGPAALIGAADDYPGTAGHTQSNDGHFATITATVLTVPEPSTFVMSFLGSLGLGLAYLNRRRRK